MSTYVLWAMIRRQSYGTETDKREARLAEVELNELINDSQKADRLDLELLNLQAERDELRAALEPFVQPDLLKPTKGFKPTEGCKYNDSIMYGRDDALLRLGDFRHAAEVLAKYAPS
jgi:hypothetical protein